MTADSSMITEALSMICDTGNREAVDEGFALMKSLADAGDMTAAAHLGYCCSLRHTGHYDAAMCREYLGMAVEAGDPLGQLYMGEMLLFGDQPFERDPVYGKWLLERSAAAGNEVAQALLARRYGVRSGMVRGDGSSLVGRVKKFLAELLGGR